MEPTSGSGGHLPQSTSLSGGYFSHDELVSLGFGDVGEGTRVSRRVEISDPSRIYLGSHVRIDAFVTITTGANGSVVIGSHTHIADRVRLSGAAGIRIGEYSGLATNSCLHSESDDYSGSWMVGPQVPSHLTGLSAGEIELGNLTVLGTNSLIMPGCKLGEGVSVGAYSMVNRSLPPWGVYFGIPVKFISRRDKAVLAYYNELEGRNGPHS